MEQTANRNKNLDRLKLIASFFVVTIHVLFPEPVGSIVKSFSGFAVPIFFMVSGYYSFRAIEGKHYSKLFSRVKKLILIFLLSDILFFAVDYAIRTISERKVFLAEGLKLSSVVKLLVFNKPLFNTPLWFLPALIYCYLVVMVFMKLDRIKLLSALSLVLLCAYIFASDIVFGFLHKEFSALIIRNFLFAGLPMFMLGYLLKKNESRLKSFSNKKAILILLGALMLFAAEYVIADACTALSNRIIATVLFLVVQNNADCKPYNTHNSVLSLVPLFVYVLHLPLANLIMFASGRMNITLSSVTYAVFPLIIICLTAGVAYLLSLFVVVLKKKGKG